MNDSLKIKKDISGRKHWYTNDQLMLAEHPFYRRSTQKRLAFFGRCIDEHIQTAHLKRDGPFMVLDAGCGDGVALKILTAKEYCQVVGCEYNFIRAQRAHSNCTQAFIVNANLTNGPFKSELFHIIVMNQVLEHIKDDISVLSELNRMLRQDGVLIIGVPNEGCFLGKLRNWYIQPWIQKQTDHTHFYTKREISTKIEKTGFSIMHLRRDGFMFPYSKVGDLLASFRCGFNLLTFLGKIFKSQCGGLYFVCKKISQQENALIKKESVNESLIFSSYIRKLIQYYDEFWKSNLIKLENEYSEYFLKEKQRLILKFLNTLNTDILLDLGCGSGLSLIPMLSKAKISLGIDVSMECLKSLRIHQKAVYLINGLAENIPLKTDTIDKIICAELMEHVIYDEIVLKEINRILRPNGLVIFNIPNGYSFFYWPKRIIRWSLAKIGIIESYKERETDFENIGKVAHLRRYSKKHFIRLLKKNGFEVIKCVGLFIDNGNRFNNLARKLSRNVASYYLLTSLSKIFPSLGLELIIKAKKLR